VLTCGAAAAGACGWPGGAAAGGLISPPGPVDCASTVMLVETAVPGWLPPRFCAAWLAACANFATEPPSAAA